MCEDVASVREDPTTVQTLPPEKTKGPGQGPIKKVTYILAMNPVNARAKSRTVLRPLPVSTGDVLW